MLPLLILLVEIRQDLGQFVGLAYNPRPDQEPGNRQQSQPRHVNHDDGRSARAYPPLNVGDRRLQQVGKKHGEQKNKQRLDGQVHEAQKGCEQQECQQNLRGSLIEEDHSLAPKPARQDRRSALWLTR